MRVHLHVYDFDPAKNLRGAGGQFAQKGTTGKASPEEVLKGSEFVLVEQRPDLNTYRMGNDFILVQPNMAWTHEKRVKGGVKRLASGQNGNELMQYLGIDPNEQ